MMKLGSSVVFLCMVHFSFGTLLEKNLFKFSEDYRFFIFVPENEGYRYASFAMSELKICRFPSGALLVNDLSQVSFNHLDEEQVERICHTGKELSLLCLDKDRLHIKGVLCGFALPGSGSNAYVFEGLYNVSSVRGVLIYRDDLRLILPHECGAGVEGEEDDGSDAFIEELLAAEENGYEGVQLPEFVVKIKRLLTPIGLYCIMRFADLRKWLVNTLVTAHGS